MAYPFTAASLLPALKIDLCFGNSTVYDDRLTEKLNTAMERIKAHGVTLQNTPGDRDLVIMYASWLWACRVTQTPMGRMLRTALNNRVFGGAPEVTP